MKRILLLFLSLTISVNLLQAQCYVGLEDGTEINHENLFLKKPAFSKKYLESGDGIKYSLDDVKYYNNHNGYYLKRVKKSGRYEFLQRELVGEIELFGITKSVSSYDYTSGMYSTQSTRWNYYRAENGPIKKVNYKNFKIDLVGCDACMKEAKKGGVNSTMSKVTFTTGLVVFIGSAIALFSQDLGPGESANAGPGIYIGPALAVSSMFFIGPARKRFKNAIMLYNEQH